MSDKSRLDYGQVASCWEESQDPVVSFVLDDGRVFGCPFFHLVDAHYLPATEQLLLRWPSGIVEIRGPKALDFYRVFSKGKGTWLKADGSDVVSVTMLTRESPPRS
jgi:hypothetical protein